MCVNIISPPTSSQISLRITPIAKQSQKSLLLPKIKMREKKVFLFRHVCKCITKYNVLRQTKMFSLNDFLDSY
jgi:hypothetical protein